MEIHIINLFFIVSRCPEDVFFNLRMCSAECFSINFVPIYVDCKVIIISAAVFRCINTGIFFCFFSCLRICKTKCMTSNPFPLGIRKIQIFPLRLRRLILPDRIRSALLDCNAALPAAVCITNHLLFRIPVRRRPVCRYRISSLLCPAGNWIENVHRKGIVVPVFHIFSYDHLRDFIPV